jgi:hypothetical protein
MKKLILISALLFSFNSWAESYSCLMNNKNFTLSRVQWTNELTQFKYQNKEIEMLFSIVNENESHIHLVRGYVDSAHYMIIGKKDESLVTALLKHESSSEVLDGSCFKIN